MRLSGHTTTTLQGASVAQQSPKCTLYFPNPFALLLTWLYACMSFYLSRKDYLVGYIQGRCALHTRALYLHGPAVLHAGAQAGQVWAVCSDKLCIVSPSPSSDHCWPILI